MLNLNIMPNFTPTETEADILNYLRTCISKRYADILMGYQTNYKLTENSHLFKKIHNILAEAAHREFKHDINTMAEIQAVLKTASN